MAAASPATSTVVFKSFCKGHEVKRFSFPSSGPSVLSLASLRGKIASVYTRPQTLFRMTYVDDEGDEIGISTDEDVREMLRVNASRPGDIIKLSITLPAPAAADEDKCDEDEEEDYEEDEEDYEEDEEDEEDEENEEEQNQGSSTKATTGSPSALFLRDINYPDDSTISADTVIHKQWAIRNNGPIAWPRMSKIILKQVNGNCGPPLCEVALPPAAASGLLPGHDCIVSVTFLTPSVPSGGGGGTARAVAIYDLYTEDNVLFLHHNRVTLDLVVEPPAPVLAVKYGGGNVVKLTSLAGGTVKVVWQMTNTGTAAWPEGCLFKYKSGTMLPSPFQNDRLGVVKLEETKASGVSDIKLPSVPVGSTIMVSALLVCPHASAAASPMSSLWALYMPDGLTEVAASSSASCHVSAIYA